MWYLWSEGQLQLVCIDCCGHSRQHSWAGEQLARPAGLAEEQAVRFESLLLCSGLRCRLQGGSERPRCLVKPQPGKKGCWYLWAKTSARELEASWRYGLKLKWMVSSESGMGAE